MSLDSKGNDPRRKRLGITFIILSYAIYGIVFIFPFIPGSILIKSIGAGVIYVFSYLIFLWGVYLMGKNTFSRSLHFFKKFINKRVK